MDERAVEERYADIPDLELEKLTRLKPTITHAK